MNSEARISDHVGQQAAERLPLLSPCINDRIRCQHSTEILLEPEGDSVFEGKLYRRCAEFFRRNSSQVRILRQGLIVVLSSLNGCSRCSRNFGQSNRVVRRWRSGRAVLCGCDESVTRRRAKQRRQSPGSKPHVNSSLSISATCFAVVVGASSSTLWSASSTNGRPQIPRLVLPASRDDTIRPEEWERIYWTKVSVNTFVQ